MVYKRLILSKTFNSLLFLVLIGTTFLNAQTILVYPKLTQDDQKTSEYTIKLLELALKHSGLNYSLKENSTKMVQTRSLEELKQNKIIDIVWSMTSKQREQDLQAIYVPLYKGLIGYRLLLINKKDKSKFQNIDSIKELKTLIAGQGHDWPDTKILRSNGIKVITGANYQGLFKMLTRNRFDYFPRSILEIWEEYEIHKHSDIIIEPRILIQYKTASYFFVNKENKKLALDLKNGFKKIINNGLFDKLFYEYYRNFIDDGNIKNRKIFSLSNPQLTKETPVDKKELWISK